MDYCDDDSNTAKIVAISMEEDNRCGGGGGSGEANLAADVKVAKVDNRDEPMESREEGELSPSSSSDVLFSSVSLSLSLLRNLISCLNLKFRTIVALLLKLFFFFLVSEPRV